MSVKPVILLMKMKKTLIDKGSEKLKEKNGERECLTFI